MSHVVGDGLRECLFTTLGPVATNIVHQLQLQLRINQQIAVVNNQYHRGNLGYFELPTGLELPDHGWHGGVQWGFRRSPAAQENIVFERSPDPVSAGVPGLDEHRDRDSFGRIIENLDPDIRSVRLGWDDHEDALRSGDTTSDVGKGFAQGMFTVSKMCFRC